MVTCTLDESINFINNNLDEDGNFYDATYDIKVSAETAKKMVEIMYEEYDLDDLMDFDIQGREDIEHYFQCTRNIIKRYYDEGFIDQETYNRSINISDDQREEMITTIEKLVS